MRAKISKWGNSLGVRIPSDAARSIGLSEGVNVEVEAKGDHLVLRVARPRYRLEDLLKEMSPADAHAAYDWGPDKGRAGE